MSCDGRVLFRRGMAVCVGAAAIVRFTLYFGHHRGAPFGFNDSPYYSETAIALTEGGWFVDRAGGPAAQHGPVTTLLLAPVSWMEAPENWQRLMTVLTGLAAVVVLGFVGRRLGGARVGLAAATIAALYPGLWLNDGLVMSESVAVLAVASWMLVTLAWQERRTPASAALMGAVAGVATLTRSELGALILAGAVAAWWFGGGRRRRMAVLAAAAAILVLAPWAAFNAARFERPVVLTTNEGATLRGANCEETYSGRALGSWAVECLVIEPGTVELEPSRRSERWREDAVRYATEHAGRLPVVLLARAGRSLDLYGLGYQVDEDVRDGRPRWGSWAAVVSFWVLVPLAFVGQRRVSRFQRVVLWTPVLTALAASLLFYGGHRLRTAMEPSIVVGSAVGAVHLLGTGSAAPGARRRPADGEDRVTSRDHVVTVTADDQPAHQGRCSP